MAILFDDVVSGNGEFTWDLALHIDFMSIEVLTESFAVQHPHPDVPDYSVKAGWIATGVNALPASSEGPFYRPPVWINFTHQLHDGYTDTSLSSHVRWWFSEGVTAHIVVAN